MATVMRALIVCVALLAPACGGEQQTPAAAEAPPDEPYTQAEGRAFTVPLFGGGEVSLAEYRGRPLVIDFWATWCLPCIKQVPIFNSFHKQHSEKIAFLAISVDADGAEAVAPFAAEHGIEYPVALASDALAQAWDVHYFPALIVVAPDGNIHKRHVGQLTEEKLYAATAPWLNR